MENKKRRKHKEQKVIDEMGGSYIIFASDSNKADFAKTIVPTVEKDCFAAFRPMFEFIRGKCAFM